MPSHTDTERRRKRTKEQERADRVLQLFEEKPVPGGIGATANRRVIDALRKAITDAETRRRNQRRGR